MRSQLNLALSSISNDVNSSVEINKIANEIQQASQQMGDSSSASNNTQPSTNNQQQVGITQDDIDLDLTIEPNADLNGSLISNTNISNQIFDFYDQSSNTSNTLESSNLKHSNPIAIKSAKSDNNLAQYSNSYQNNIVKISETHLRQASIDSTMCPISIGTMGQNKENDLEAVSNLYNKLLINNNLSQNTEQQQHSASSTNSSMSCSSSLSLTSSSSTQLNENNLMQKKVVESMEEHDAFKADSFDKLITSPALSTSSLSGLSAGSPSSSTSLSSGSGIMISHHHLHHQTYQMQQTEMVNMNQQPVVRWS